METQDKIKQVTESMYNLLLNKNRKYGNSSLEPYTIFKQIIESGNEDMATIGLLTRLSDKLKRVENSNILRKNDVSDIIGYFILLSIKKDWLNFDDLID